MVAQNGLSEADLEAARTELSASRPFTVWFTAAAVGVPAGRSAKVISIDDAAEGDYIQVKPAGSSDTMFCSPSELTTVRPSRKRAQQPVEKAAPAQAKSQAPAPKPPAPSPKRTTDRSRSPDSRSAGRPAEVTVTLHATAEGEWTVEVVIGKKRAVRPTSVQPADVAKAARSLPSAVAEEIESALEAARQRQLERVERLRAELDAAQRALQELSN